MRGRLYLLTNYLQKLIRSKSRIVLTVCGLIISAILLTSGLVLSETLLDNELANIRCYSDQNLVLINGDVNMDIYNELKKNVQSQNDIELRSKSDKMYEKISNSISREEQEISIMLKDIRVNYDYDFNLISTGENTSSRHESRIIFGTAFTSEDIDHGRKYAIVCSAFAELFFGKTDVVGEYMTIPTYGENIQEMTYSIMYYENYKIVGVYQASEYEEGLKRSIMNQTIGDKDMVSFDVYIPLSCSINNKSNSEYQMTCLLSGDVNYETTAYEARSILYSEGKIGKYDVFDYQTMYLPIKDKIQSFQLTLMCVVVFIFTISGISMTNTMLFSVKERISEIGIRKAIGAFSEDIVIQFLIEGLVYGVISALIGIFLSLTIISTLFILFGSFFFRVETLSVSLTSLVLVFVCSCFTGIISSILPAIYAARIKIVDAIKFD